MRNPMRQLVRYSRSTGDSPTDTSRYGGSSCFGEGRLGFASGLNFVIVVINIVLFVLNVCSLELCPNNLVSWSDMGVGLAWAVLGTPFQLDRVDPVLRCRHSSCLVHHRMGILDCVAYHRDGTV